MTPTDSLTKETLTQALTPVSLDSSSFVEEKETLLSSIAHRPSWDKFARGLTDEENAYLDTLTRGEIPTYTPDSLTTDIMGIEVHSFHQKIGYYGKVTQEFVEGSIPLLGENPVLLDPMAGRDCEGQSATDHPDTPDGCVPRTPMA